MASRKIQTYQNKAKNLCTIYFAFALAGECIFTHTHPFNGPFSRTTRVGRYQKGKTNLHQHPTTQFFYRPDALPAAQPTASKQEGQTAGECIFIKTKHYSD